MPIETINILLVEDSPSDALLARDELEGVSDPRFVIAHQTRLDEALGQLETASFDAVVLDLNLPDSEGLSTYERIQSAAKGLPVVILSGLGDEGLAARVVKAGAQDYLMKGHLGERLLARAIRYAIERERVEQALRESEQRSRNAFEALSAVEERMRFALEAARIGIWDMDFSTGAHHWSENLEAQFGLQPGTFGGSFEAWVDMVHPDDRPSVRDAIQSAMKTGEEFSVEHRVTWPTGATRWLRGIGRIYLDDRGEPQRGIGVSIDTTEQNTLQAQYLQAQKMEAVGRLAGGVAHDFNNLLTAILGYCELLLRKEDVNSQDQADLEEIQKAATTATALTSQLLAFSRKQIIAPTALDLNAVLADMRRMVERLIGEDVVVTLRLKPGRAGIMADRSQMEQVVLNLAVNARDAMPKGGRLSITVADINLDQDSAKRFGGIEPGDYVMLSVADSGGGMTPEVQARLFEPFFTTKGQGRGTGLGLATVHNIIKRSGGAISVDSAVGKGTVFKLCLPRLGGEAADREAKPPAAQSGSRGETILVVDDEEGLAKLTKRLLIQQGYTVLMAANAAEAVQAVETYPTIDLLLTDVVMPDVSGPELAERLVAHRPGLKVLYMSGYTEDIIVKHDLLRSGVALLRKPFTGVALGARLREVLDT